MNNNLQLKIYNKFDQSLAEQWDKLLACSKLQSIFFHSSWLKSWLDSLNEIGTDPSNSLAIVCVTASGETSKEGETLLAGCAFYEIDGVAYVLSRERADYSDILVTQQLSRTEQLSCAFFLLEEYLRTSTSIQSIMLHKVPEDSFICTHMLQARSSPYMTICNHLKAPTMFAASVENALKKKSLKRHHNKLLRQGTVSISTFNDWQDIEPRLPEFFRLHQKRWQDTNTPSLFRQEFNQILYLKLGEYLGCQGHVRYTEVRQEAQLLAAHFGFVFGGRFVWYKPCYDPEWASFSPGEVLLKALIEEAQKESVDEFDFTIGDEPFKFRFADHIREVFDIHVTMSVLDASKKRIRQYAKKLLMSLGIPQNKTSLRSSTTKL